MRGKDFLDNLRNAYVGITPAYAGKRLNQDETICSHQDHPRLCGEKPDWDGLDKTAQGSPPPMRGKDL